MAQGRIPASARFASLWFTALDSLAKGGGRGKGGEEGRGEGGKALEQQRTQEAP